MSIFCVETEAVQHRQCSDNNMHEISNTDLLFPFNSSVIHFFHVLVVKTFCFNQSLWWPLVTEFLDFLDLIRNFFGTSNGFEKCHFFTEVLKLFLNSKYLKTSGPLILIKILKILRKIQLKKASRK